MEEKNSLVSHTICRRKTASALAATYNPISFGSLKWHRLPKKHKEMGTEGACPLRTLCFRQQYSHNPVFLTSRGSEQKTCICQIVHFPCAKAAPSSHGSLQDQLLASAASYATFTCVITHLTQWHQQEQTTVFQEIFPAHITWDKSCRNGDGQDSAHLLHGGLELPNSKQRVTVPLKLRGLHNSCARFLSPIPLNSSRSGLITLHHS